MMERLLEKIGYAGQRFSDALARHGGDSRSDGDQPGGESGDLLEELGDLLPEGISPELVASAASAVGAWAVSRYLTRGRVRWARAILAGIAGTLLHDLTEQIDRRVLPAASNRSSSLQAAAHGEEASSVWAEAGARYGAGVTLALFYASYLHHRLPGPAPLRGAVFGGLDAAAARWGGLLPLLHRIHPDLDLPTGFTGLSRGPATGGGDIVRHLAFGVGVGAAYGR